MIDHFEGLADSRLSDAEKAAVAAHYQHAAPLLALDFPNVPLVSSYHVDGLGNPPRFRETWQPGELPDTMSAVDVLSVRGAHHTYLGLTANTVLWLVHRGAVGMLSWTPSLDDPDALGYARILLRRSNNATEETLKYALQAMRAMLQECGLVAIPVLDGHDGAALFVPFGDRPPYAEVREWLHVLCGRAVERHAALLTVVHDQAQRGDRVHLAVKSNAVGLFSALPYSLAGNPSLGMTTPLEWEDLNEVHNGSYTAHNSAERLQTDVFAAMSAAIGMQRFASVR